MTTAEKTDRRTVITSEFDAAGRRCSEAGCKTTPNVQRITYLVKDGEEKTRNHFFCQEHAPA